MNDALAIGLQLTVLGMGLVFLLLALLWALMVVMVRFDRPEPEAKSALPATAAPVTELDPALRAAMLIAVMRYRDARQPAPSEPATGHWVHMGRARQHQSNSARRRG